jgi:hypothetical protein
VLLGRSGHNFGSGSEITASSISLRWMRKPGLAREVFEAGNSPLPLTCAQCSTMVYFRSLMSAASSSVWLTEKDCIRPCGAEIASANGPLNETMFRVVLMVKVKSPGRTRIGGSRIPDVARRTSLERLLKLAVILCSC